MLKEHIYFILDTEKSFFITNQKMIVKFIYKNIHSIYSVVIKNDAAPMMLFFLANRIVVQKNQSKLPVQQMLQHRPIQYRPTNEQYQLLPMKPMRPLPPTQQPIQIYSQRQSAPVKQQDPYYQQQYWQLASLNQQSQSSQFNQQSKPQHPSGKIYEG